MADDSLVDSFKEKYIEEAVSLLPLAQLVFIIITSVVVDDISKNACLSGIECFSRLGLKDLFGEAGRAWSINLSLLTLIGFVSVLNGWFLRAAIEKSLQSVNLDVHLARWQASGAASAARLTDSERIAALSSISNELKARIRKYRVRRMLAELAYSGLVAQLIWDFALLRSVNYSMDFLVVSWHGLLWSACFAVAAVVSHRAAIRYVISQAIPLKVFSTVLSGEIIFVNDSSI